MLTSTNKFTVSPIFLANQIQVRGDDLRRALTAQGYTHVVVNDDDTFCAMTPTGQVVEKQYMFIRKIFV